MFDKYNPIYVVHAHLDTFRDAGTNEINLREKRGFFLIPFFFGLVALYLFKFTLSEEIAGALITSLSVFSALLLNLLLLIFDIVNRDEGKEHRSSRLEETRIDLLKETYHNLSFSILISVVAIIFLLLTYLTEPPFVGLEAVFDIFLSFIVYYLVVMFMITLLMVLKRVHFLLSREIERSTEGVKK